MIGAVGGEHEIHRRDLVARAAAAAGTIVLSLTLALGAALAQDKTYIMKITLPTLNDPSYVFAKAYAAASRAFRRPHQAANFSVEPIGLDPEADRRHAVRRHPVRAHSAEFFVGVDERFEVMAAPGLVNSIEHRRTPRRRSGGAQADARAWRQQGAARRRAVHELAVFRYRKKRRSATWRISRARRSGFLPRRFKCRRSSGWARRRWR